jgi:catalase
MAEELVLGREYPPEGEERLIEQILTICQLSMKNQGNNYPPTLREQHPKSHGYVKGEFIVEENISDDLKVGVFAKPKTYPIWIRFSNGENRRDPDGNFLSDTKGDIRGMAIKLMGVEGKMAIDNSPHPGEQDFILMNNPTFFIRDVQGYIDFFPIMNAIKKGEIIMHKDKPPTVPENLQEKFQAISYAFSLAQKIKGQSTPSPLEISYWSATPYKFGQAAIKFSVFPHNNGNFDSETATDKSNYLREAMTKYLANEDAYFDFNVQLQKDASKMPVEDPTVEWDEQLSPYVKVATIRIPKQDFNTEEQKKLDEKQSFSPWNSLLEHQPLGGVNRARKIYAEMSEIRNKTNRESESP